MAQNCPNCGAPAYGHPSYNPMDESGGVVYRFNCGECGHMWESDSSH